MHRFMKKNNLVDSGSGLSKHGFGVTDEPPPVCPKPRRLGAALPEFLKPPKCSKHREFKTEGRSEILNMISGKSEDSRDLVCNGCSASFCSGSPPSRSDNPLVHDVEFIHQMQLLSPLTRTTLSDRLAFTSASPL